MSSVDRRKFLCQATASIGAVAAGASMGLDPLDEVPGDFAPPPENAPMDPDFGERRDYNGPNLILVRFGGGVRRLETIQDDAHTFCPFIYHELGRRHGVLCKNMEIASAPHIKTSHGEGTLYILTGQYDAYQDIENQFLGECYEPTKPTLFEYFRRTYNIPAHQALIINGEDRINEEFFTYSRHHQFGVRYKSTVLSLYRFKTYLLRQELANNNLSDRERRRKELRLRQMEAFDYRSENRNSNTVRSTELDEFWERWRRYYGDSGLVNPRGDRLLTTLCLWSLRYLRPRMMMINYNDPDYVHWGNPSFYTRAISIIDEGVREIYNAVQADEEYRDNTIFVVVPDCGRDNNRGMSVPYQHHFGGLSSHQIFSVFAGPQQWIPRSAQINDRSVSQTNVAATIGSIMGFQTPLADEAMNL